MRKTFYFIILIVISSINTALSQSNSIDKFFSKEANNANFTQVVVSDKMLGMLSEKEGYDQEIKDILSKLNGLNILKTEKSPNDFFNLAKSKYKSSNYEELMSVKDHGSNVVFYSTGSNGRTVKELVMLIGNSSQTVLMSFTGNINLDEISKLGQALDIQGADKLKELGK